ncbi:MAG: LysR substrate-binding domain-containing protein [Cyanobacteriota bacterium]|jgi:DNA-binding transcriptional LysR family regulator
MTLEQLRIFLAVAQHLHFTKAADALYITQPAVSAAIQNLESEYGIKLFHRLGRHIEITQAGQLLQLEAQKILDQVKLAERGLRELNDLQKGDLNLGASFTIAHYWLPEKISAFKETYPGITIHCTLANADDICEGTASGLFDLGIIAGEVKETVKSSLKVEGVGSDRLQVIVGRNHAWFHRDSIASGELLESSWIMREAGSGTQQMFEQALANWGIKPHQLKITLVLNSSEMVRSVVESGRGATALPELMVKKELALQTLRAIPVIDPDNKTNSAIERPILKLTHRQRFQTRVTQAFEMLLFQLTS